VHLHIPFSTIHIAKYNSTNNKPHHSIVHESISLYTNTKCGNILLGISQPTFISTTVTG
jgi:hypothetical protein